MCRELHCTKKKRVILCLKFKTQIKLVTLKVRFFFLLKAKETSSDISAVFGLFPRTGTNEDVDDAGKLITHKTDWFTTRTHTLKTLWKTKWQTASLSRLLQSNDALTTRAERVKWTLWCWFFYLRGIYIQTTHTLFITHSAVPHTIKTRYSKQTHSVSSLCSAYKNTPSN